MPGLEEVVFAVLLVDEGIGALVVLIVDVTTDVVDDVETGTSLTMIAPF